MEKWYLVWFKYSDKVYCTNLCIAKSKEDAEEYYSTKYSWVSVKDVAEWEADMYQKRGMPAIKL